ncbi:hypothetical protein [Deinococcus sp. Leaf326]|uniref:hypothetical protein n=1 Tax=Deinococcus sp. Leaf326 TaxID=1736338 RepID=UPI0006FD2792|nr:hypothetical protein [Deinococcus sp. Leaf326]KQR33149.1 hypothetical protein ASF71_16800 [Deinococcus sp. Leaf326]
MTRRALDLPLMTACAALPTDLTDERLLEQDAAVREGLASQPGQGGTSARGTAHRVLRQQ